MRSAPPHDARMFACSAGLNCWKYLCAAGLAMCFSHPLRRGSTAARTMLLSQRRYHASTRVPAAVTEPVPTHAAELECGAHVLADVADAGEAVAALGDHTASSRSSCSALRRGRGCPPRSGLPAPLRRSRLPCAGPL